MKALMPILVALIGFKAMKAFIMAKLALTLVLGFLATQLIKKVGMKMPMQMNPMQMMQPPQPEYGAPIPPTTGSPAAYESSNGWEGSNYNSRVWDTTNLGSSHNLAYNSYYSPSSSSNLNSNNFSATGSSYSSYSVPLTSAPTSSSLTSSTSTSSSTQAHAY